MHLKLSDLAGGTTCGPRTAFNRLLALTGARVIDVFFGAEGITVLVALRRRRLLCSRCGQVSAPATTARGGAGGTWSIAGRRCFIAYELRRVECRDCGVRVEAVPWARPEARHTRDFEDLVVRHEAPLNRVGEVPTAGLSQQSGEAGGSLTLETRGVRQRRVDPQGRPARGAARDRRDDQGPRIGVVPGGG